MFNIDENKLAKLSTTNQMLDEKYGIHGTASRNAFDEESYRELREVVLENSKRNLSQIISRHVATESMDK